MSKRRSPKQKSKFNKFFDKIFVISLYDKVERWEKVLKQFKGRKIDVERFIAIDGRCSKEGEVGCLQKLNTFEMIYDVKISNKKKLPLKEIVPAASLTIGTILILRHMVKQKLSHILICEDDVVLSKSLDKKFEQGLKEIGNKKWDLLYLGGGNQTGNNGVSYKQTRKNKNLSDIAKFMNDDFYVSYKDDLRVPCEELCEPISEHISKVYNPGGTWAYAYSLAGAKKLLKLIDNDAGNHIDKIIGEQTMAGKMKGLAFDPPIIWHEGGAIRGDTDIPWEW
jgi:GR25 family glycosyltransferase involved in LPS biosynthesis